MDIRRTAAAGVLAMTGSGLARRMSGVLPSDGPQRALVLSSFVNRIGNGLFNTASALYFTLVVHLPVTQVGVGRTVAGLVGLLAGVPAGDLADRHGPRVVVLVTLAVQTGAMTAFVLVHSFVAFTLIAVVDRLAASAYNASCGALVARAGGDRLALSAGFALGCGLAPDHAPGRLGHRVGASPDGCLRPGRRCGRGRRSVRRRPGRGRAAAGWPGPRGRVPRGGGRGAGRGRRRTSRTGCG